MQQFVAYYRVKAVNCKRCKAELDAQRSAVSERLGGGGVLILECVEAGSVERSARFQALRQAVRAALSHNATLIIAKIGRLTKSSAVMSLLQESAIRFCCCDRPEVSHNTVDDLAETAKAESRRLSLRVRMALAEYKAQGGVLGASRPACRNLSVADRQLGTRVSMMGRYARLTSAYADVRPVIEGLRASGFSLRTIAHELNQGGCTTIRGRPWSATQVFRVLQLAKNVDLGASDDSAKKVDEFTFHKNARDLQLPS